AERNPKLPVAYIAAIEKEQDLLAVSAISVWEIALAVKKGRIVLSVDIERWIDETCGDMGLQIIPLDRDIALEVNRLPEPFHQDPADRIIVATARLLEARLVTVDQAILAYPYVSIYDPG